MLKLLKDIIEILPKKQLKELLQVQIIGIAMAVSELVNLILIWTVINNLVSPKDKNTGMVIEFIQKLSNVMGIENEKLFLYLVIICSLIFLYTLSFFGNIKAVKFSTKIGSDWIKSLYKFYIQQPWLFHINRNSNTLTKNMFIEVQRTHSQIIQPIIQINIKILTMIGISISLLILNPWIILFTVTLLLLFYSLVYIIFRKNLYLRGQKTTLLNSMRQKLVTESLGEGIKNVLLYNMQPFFIEKVTNCQNKIFQHTYKKALMSQLPAYFLQLIIMLTIVLLAMYLSSNKNLYSLLPLFSVYALAILKILPASQSTYSQIAMIKANLSSLEHLKEDLVAANNHNVVEGQEITLPFENTIELKNVDFRYPVAKDLSLKNISLKIQKNTTVALTGGSGAGKTTLIDIISALLLPQNGYLKIDEEIITKANKKYWQRNIGVVPQDIFLTDDTIVANVAFGYDKIDKERIVKALKQAQLWSLVEAMPEKIHTQIGERGVQLSGGQKQRLAIARVLYRDANILLFDEATNALDGMTEKMIMETMKALGKEKTIIIIAHRLNTIKHCDNIFYMEKGQIIDQGSYEELKGKNIKFEELTELS